MKTHNILDQNEQNVVPCAVLCTGFFIFKDNTLIFVDMLSNYCNIVVDSDFMGGERLVYDPNLNDIYAQLSSFCLNVPFDPPHALSPM